MGNILPLIKEVHKMSDEKEITDQTAFQIAGIPTPPDQQDCAATDMLSEAVENIMDNLQKEFQGESDNKSS
jgi:UDP-glucose 6-dehydrogenase